MFSDNVTNAWWFISLYLFLLIALTFVTFGKSNLMRFIAHHFNLEYSDRKLKMLDKK